MQHCLCSNADRGVVSKHLCNALKVQRNLPAAAKAWISIAKASDVLLPQFEAGHLRPPRGLGKPSSELQTAL
jgi:hypothetical protein